MRAVDATGNRTVPLEVDSESVRLDASYLSIVPRTLNVGGGAARRLRDTRSLPEASIADSRSTVRFFFMTDLLTRSGTGYAMDIKGRAGRRGGTTAR